MKTTRSFLLSAAFASLLGTSAATQFEFEPLDAAKRMVTDVADPVALRDLFKDPRWPYNSKSKPEPADMILNMDGDSVSGVFFKKEFVNAPFFFVAQDPSRRNVLTKRGISVVYAGVTYYEYRFDRILPSGISEGLQYLKHLSDVEAAARDGGRQRIFANEFIRLRIKNYEVAGVSVRLSPDDLFEAGRNGKIREYAPDDLLRAGYLPHAFYLGYLWDVRRGEWVSYAGLSKSCDALPAWSKPHCAGVREFAARLQEASLFGRMESAQDAALKLTSSLPPQ